LALREDFSRFFGKIKCAPVNAQEKGSLEFPNNTGRNWEKKGYACNYASIILQSVDR
jgi:hypothetical protein